MLRRSLHLFQKMIDTPTRFPWTPGNSWKSQSRYVKRRWSFPKPGQFPRNNTPLQKQAKVQCVDNTNCRQFFVLKQVGEKTHHHTIVPVIVRRVAILRFKSGQDIPPRQKLVPGTVMYAVLMARRQVNARHSGLSVQFDKNAGILLNEKFVPVGTRVMYSAGRHINHRFFLKAAVMANFIV